jgi:Tfp pilus assembly protein PilF
MDQFKHALAASPNNAQAAAGLAGAYFLMGQLPEAEKAARDAIEAHPDSGDAHLWLARTLAAKGQPADLQSAEEEFKQTLALSKDSASVNGHFGAYYLQKGDPKRAIEVLNDAIKQKPYDKDYYPMLVRAYRKIGKNSDADLMQKKYHDLDQMTNVFKRITTQVWMAPENVDLRLKLIKTYLEYHRPDLARRQGDQLARLAPNNPEVKAMLAQIPAKTKDISTGAVPQRASQSEEEQ